MDDHCAWGSTTKVDMDDGERGERPLSNRLLNLLRFSCLFVSKMITLSDESGSEYKFS